LVSGLSRLLRIDPGYLRVLAGILNILTIGLLGVIYLITVILLERKGKVEEHVTASSEVDSFKMFNRPVQVFMGAMLLLLAVIRVTTEYRLFFFNEPFAVGLVLTAIGGIFTFSALNALATRDRGRLWIIVGPMVLLYGIYQLSTALFHVQLPFAARFEVLYLLIGTSFIYYGLVALRDNARTVGVALGILFYFFAILVQGGLISSHFLVLIAQFYDFFYPIIFAGMGLWMVMDR
jgi:hypothetical protein